MSKALVVIDVQNDYFPGGSYPLWQSEAVLETVVAAVARARQHQVPVVLVQHVGSAASPFFKPGTSGVELHPRLVAAAGDAPVVVKQRADSFLRTTLEATLAACGVTDLLLCGMMTQNCVTHTALSRAAERYRVTVLPDACTTVDAMIHNIALNALADRVALLAAVEAV